MPTVAATDIPEKRGCPRQNPVARCADCPTRFASQWRNHGLYQRDAANAETKRHACCGKYL